MLVYDVFDALMLDDVLMLEAYEFGMAIAFAFEGWVGGKL